MGMTLLFDRKLELITESKYKFSKEDGVEIEFKYTTMDKSGIPTAEITIKNLDREARNLLKKEKASLSIGYGEMFGELIFGDIKNIDLSDEPEITFDLVSNGYSFSRNLSKHYNRQTREGYIIRDICRNFGGKITGSELLDTYYQPNGISISGNVLNTITKICNNRGLGVTTRGETIVIYNLKEKDTKKTGNIILNVTSGLTNCVKYVADDEEDKEKYDYIVKALPIPGLTQGDLIKVEHDNLNAIVQIKDFIIYGRKNWTSEYYVRVVG